MLDRKSGFRLFDIMGFRVSADWSWLIIAVLLSFSLATGYYPAVLGADSSTAFWGLGIISALLLFFSVVLHEVGHSYVARNHGIRILGIRLFIFGGVAQMDREPRSPGIELKVALAGPAVSAILALVFYLFSQFLAGPATSAMAAVSFFLARVNLAMVLFNMIPGFPMDGGRVLRALVWKAKNDYYYATRIATNIGRYVAFGFMGLGGLMALAGGFGNGLWLILIGAFLYQAARSNQIYAEYSRAQDMMSGGTLPESDYVEATLSVQRFIDGYLRHEPTAQFPVVYQGRLVGAVDAGAVRGIPQLMRRFVRVAEIMTPLRRNSGFNPSERFFDNSGYVDAGNGIFYEIYEKKFTIIN